MVSGCSAMLKFLSHMSPEKLLRFIVFKVVCRCPEPLKAKLYFPSVSSS